MHLLLLFDKGIVLSNTTESKFVHQVDFVWRVHMLVLEALDHNRERGAEEHDLAIFRVEAEQLLNDRGEFWRQKLVGLVHDKCLATRKICYPFSSQIQNSAWCSNNDVDGVAQSDNIVFQPSAARGHHDVDTKVLSKRLADLRGLEGELSSGDEDESLCLCDLGIYALECRDDECSSLSGTVLRSRKDIATGQSYGYRLFLNGGWLLESGLEDAHHEFTPDEEILEVEAFCCSDILSTVLA